MARIKIEDLEPVTELTDDQLGDVAGGYYSYSYPTTFSAYDAWTPESSLLNLSAYDAWTPESSLRTLSSYDAWTPGG